MTEGEGRRDGWDGARLGLEGLDLPAVVIDREGRLGGASPRGRALLQAFGCEPAEVAPLHPDLLATLDAAPLGDAVVWSPGGTLDDASLGCARHRLGDEHYLVVMRELTHKNRELTRRLHQQRLEVTGRLVASLVHDLRAPLASMVFSGEMLMGRIEGFSAAEIAEMVADIVASGRRLRQIVDSLLGFARASSEDEASHLDDVLDRVSSLVRPVLRERGHTLRTYVAPGARRVRGAGLMIEQIVVNLVLNAAEAADEPIEIVVTAAPEEARPGWVRVRVMDEGPGIPEAVRGRVFQPFFTTKPTGTGLGLTTGREAAREQGGDLVLDDDEGTGASFSLYLSVEPAGGTS
ncbi:MAG: HAMP domain-containing histidine kinase [Sandaracinaceae bacterium]|nr:HAMP domain-containing histidine kinase [Sandaracinaceae bacterium]